MRDFATSLEAEIPALRRYARVLLRDHEAAEDLLQSSVERAWSRRHLWRRPDHFRAWLFRIMHNLHANEVRAVGRRPASVDLAEHNHPNAAASQELCVEVAQTLEAVDRLSAGQREVLLLVAVEGMSYREASKVVGVAPGTVVSRIARARERLRKLREGEAHPPARLRRVK